MQLTRTPNCCMNNKFLYFFRKLEFFFLSTNNRLQRVHIDICTEIAPRIYYYIQNDILFYLFRRDIA